MLASIWRGEKLSWLGPILRCLDLVVGPTTQTLINIWSTTLKKRLERRQLLRYTQSQTRSWPLLSTYQIVFINHLCVMVAGRSLLETFGVVLPQFFYFCISRFLDFQISRWWIPLEFVFPLSTHLPQFFSCLSFSPPPWELSTNIWTEQWRKLIFILKQI